MLSAEVSRLIQTRPSGLLSDFDGTLSRISNDPAGARIDPQIKAALLQLAPHFDVIGVVTGRSAREAARLVSIEGAICLGNHGFEHFEDGEITVADGAADYLGPMQRVLDEARERLNDPLIYFEDKGVTGSIHYRNASNPAVARDQILKVISPLIEREGIRLSEGRMVIELRPPIDVNKGTALCWVVQQYDLKSVIFMGDDVTDLDAMRALKNLRDAGTIDGLSIGVVGPETPDEVAEESDRVVTGVEGVSAFLEELVGNVTGTAQQ